jgi:hypothetical protein
MSEHTAENGATTDGHLTMSTPTAEREHNDGCLTEHTWNEDDCNCRCSTCGNRLPCRWAPRVIPPGSTDPSEETT